MEGVRVPPSGRQPDGSGNRQEDMVSGSESDFLSGVFAQLVDNKDLPKYQFERAIDGFIGFFLPDIIGALMGGRAELVTQELPLKKENNQSTNVDYVLLLHGDSRPSWVFVELKTDTRSFRRRQDQIYCELILSDRRMDSLMHDMESIKKASTQGKKYAHQMGKVEKHKDKYSCPIRVAYLALEPHQLTKAVCRGCPREKAECAPSDLNEDEFRSFTFHDDLQNLHLRDWAEQWELFRTKVISRLENPHHK